MAYEAIVIGGGATGASVLYFLARKGVRRTLLLDGGSYAGGSTGRSAAMIRVFHSSRSLTDWASESLPHFLDFEKEVGRSCGFRATGSLYFENAASLASRHADVQRLRRLGHRIEILDKKRGESRFPQIAWPERTFAVYEPDAGYADPAETTRAWIRRASDLGAEGREAIRVRELLVHAGKVRGVSTDQGEFHAPIVVVAAGAWTAELLEPHGVRLPLERRAIQLQRFRGERPKGLHPIFFDRGTRSYGRPDGESATVVGCGSFVLAPGQGADEVGNRDEARRVRDLASRTVRGIGRSRLTDVFQVSEAYTADRRGLLGEVGAVPGLVVAAGFSGTGFKVAPAIGRRVAQLVERRLK